MMRGVPASFPIIVFKHRKVGDPQKTVVVCRSGFSEGAVFVFVLLSKRETNLSGSGVHRLGGFAHAHARVVLRRLARNHEKQIVGFGLG